MYDRATWLTAAVSTGPDRVSPLGRPSFGALRHLRRRFGARVDRFKRRGARSVRRELVADPHVALAVRAHAAATGESEERAWARVREYAAEIVPSFSLVAYYRLGYLVSRALIPLFYRVSVGHEAREALNAIPRTSSVVYLMNHRSNADYVVVAFVLSGEVAISYAVGEWARVWPLEALFKSFGSYFVRRGYREPLYHKVLERYVQLATRSGVTQGIFIEGGLTRDGRFRPPKLGLLDSLVRTKLEPGFDLPLTIIPVAINYDRVLEDRSLLRELQAPEERLPRREQIREVARYVLKVSALFLLGRARRYGRACVNFGAPLRVDDWLAENPGVLLLPREERLPRLKALADDVMRRVGSVMPVTAVALASDALLRHAGDTIDRARWEGLLAGLRLVLKSARAPVVGDERPNDELLDRALVMLTMRRVVVPQGDGFRIDRSQEPLLRYYANSIAHFLEPFEGPPR
jgi:glycerol-3-phosphate O-acyltransferase